MWGNKRDKINKGEDKRGKGKDKRIKIRQLLGCLIEYGELFELFPEGIVVLIVLCFFGRLRIVFDEPGDYGGPSTMCCDGERRNSCNLNERSEFFVASLFRRGVVDFVVEHLLTAGLLPYFLDDAIHDGEDFG